MAINRLETLQAMLAANPADAFARYGLAMEYRNQGQLDRAADEFRALLEAHPAYTAAYYHGGQTLEQLGRPAEARALYRQGIDLTTRTGDNHTRSELQAALDLL